jgi:hypothetical protein
MFNPFKNAVRLVCPHQATASPKRAHKAQSTIPLYNKFELTIIRGQGTL